MLVRYSLFCGLCFSFFSSSKNNFALPHLQIRFSDRLKHDKGRTCKIYHDGVDFKCFNKRNPGDNSVRPQRRRYPFDPSYNSHKFNYAGLRYGISTCIQTGEIVSCHGPFPAGKWADIKQSIDALSSHCFSLVKWLKLMLDIMETQQSEDR